VSPTVRRLPALRWLRDPGEPSDSLLGLTGALVLAVGGLWLAVGLAWVLG
jgi:hypothetical protein